MVVEAVVGTAQRRTCAGRCGSGRVVPERCPATGARLACGSRQPSSESRALTSTGPTRLPVSTEPAARGSPGTTSGCDDPGVAPRTLHRWLLVALFAAASLAPMTAHAAQAQGSAIVETPRSPEIAALASPAATVSVDGSGFGASEHIVLSFGDPPVSIGSADSDANGAFSASVTIPAAAPPGDQAVIATGGPDNAQASFDVNTDWLQFHFDAQKDGVNEAENQVTGNRVKILVPAGDAETTGAVSGSPVVVKGSDGTERVLVTDGAGNLYGFEGGQNGEMDPLWEMQEVTNSPLTAPAAFGTTVYFGAGDGTLYAYDMVTGESEGSMTVAGGEPLVGPPTIDLNDIGLPVLYVATASAAPRNLSTVLRHLPV
jgi:hypothetical protein